MNTLHFDAATHTYTLGGRKLPSVTQACSVLTPDAFARVPPAVLARKRAIGVALHAAIALDVAGELDEDTIAPEVAPYFAAWRRSMQIAPLKVIECEVPRASERYGYAGTPDLVALSERTGARWLLDVKSVAMLSPVTAIQTAAYAALVDYSDTHRDIRTGMNMIRRGALHLKPDGTFEIREHVGAGDFQTFLAALQVHRWRAANIQPTTTEQTT